MPADLERQLPRFAEALDRRASAISVEEILSSGTVDVDVSRLERPLWEQARRVDGASSGGLAGGPGQDGERHASIELASTAPEPRTRRRVAAKIALAAAAAVVLFVALAAIVRLGDRPGPAVVPPSTLDNSVPTTTEVATSGGMWPQSTLAEVRAAQERADAGDPDYTWQVDPRLVEDDSWIGERHQVQLVDRFLREVLGWEAYMLNPFVGMARGDVYDVSSDQRYLRCEPGRTNPLYPPGADPAWGESCAPTLSDLRYESVSLDLAQRVRQDREGIWVVTRWAMTAPFAQADPLAVEAGATERLEEFLTARIAGSGAEGFVQVGADEEVPLLYATTSGASYERYEIERVDGPSWPYGSMTFAVRLFAEGDATVVQQQIVWDRNRSGGLWMDVHATTENGRPTVLTSTSPDGEVTLSASADWRTWLPGGDDVWFGGLWREEDGFGNGERIELVDPVAYDAWCAANGGSPLLAAPADANAIVQQLVADPNFETTAPVPARVGGLEAVSVDVALAPGGSPCGIGMIDIARWIHGLYDSGWRLRLFLVDLPEGMSVETLAITVVAPADRFDEFVAETSPIIESIEFHPG